MGEQRGLRGPSHKFHPLPRFEQKLFYPRLESSFSSGTGFPPGHREDKPGKDPRSSEGGELR